MKDVFKHKQQYDNFKARVLELGGIEGITKANSDIILKFLNDMENGVNTGKGSVKGARSPGTLKKLSGRLIQEIKWLEERGIKNVVQNPKATEKAITTLFNDMRNGVLKTSKGLNKGQKYKSIDTYSKSFIAFWNWWIKINRKNGKQIPKITEDLDTSPLEKDPGFVYATKEQIDQMLPYFTEEEQLIILFAFDSLIRSPTEFLNLKVKDIYEE